MNKVLAIFMLLTVLQLVHSQNPKFVNCFKKITQQIGSIKDTKTVPKCVDKIAVLQAQKKAKVFKDIYQKIYNDCKADMSTCTLKMAETINAKEETIKITVKAIVTLLTKAFSGCYDDLEKNMSNINQYIANGCETPKQ